MKLPRIPAALCAAVMISAFLAAPPRARANDCAIPFGARVSAAPVSGRFVAAVAAQWATTSAHALISSLAMHQDHPDLGGSIAWHPTAWNVHEGKGQWHHDDDGGDDEHSRHSVPEPSTGLLMFSGVSAFAAWRLRRQSQQA